MLLLQRTAIRRARAIRGGTDRDYSSCSAGFVKGFLRGSPRRFTHPEDGKLVLDPMRNAERYPVSRPVDARKLARKPFFKAEPKVGRQASRRS